MAITGDGSQEYPWLVHSYDELKTATTDRTYIPAYGKSWIALDANIDCNDYGADFEWETINLGFAGSSYVPYGAASFDLNGHTIKNIPVKLNNSLFNANFTASNQGNAEFKGNGKLLNVFTQPNSTAYLIVGRNASNVVSNLSLSTNLGKGSYGVFLNTKVENSAIYAEQSQVGGDAILLYSTTDSDSSYCTLSNVDAKIFVTGHFNNHITWTASGTIGTKPLILSSRIQGKMKSNEGLNSGWLSRGKLTNSVVNLDMSEASFGSMSYSGKWSCENGSDGVMNVDNQPTNQQYEVYFTRGMTACTSSDLISGDALRGKGFTVVNVVGD